MKNPKNFFIMLPTPEGALMPHKLVRGTGPYCIHFTPGRDGWDLMATIQWSHIDSYLSLMGVEKNDRDYFTGRIDFPTYLWNLTGPGESAESESYSAERLTHN